MRNRRFPTRYTSPTTKGSSPLTLMTSGTVALPSCTETRTSTSSIFRLQSAVMSFARAFRTLELAAFDSRDLDSDILLPAGSDMVITDLAGFIGKQLDSADPRRVLFRYDGLYQKRRLLFFPGYLVDRTAYRALDASLAGLCQDRMLLYPPAIRTIYSQFHHQQPVYVCHLLSY